MEQCGISQCFFAFVKSLSYKQNPYMHINFSYQKIPLKTHLKGPGCEQHGAKIYDKNLLGTGLYVNYQRLQGT